MPALQEYICIQTSAIQPRQGSGEILVDEEVTGFNALSIHQSINEAHSGLVVMLIQEQVDKINGVFSCQAWIAVAIIIDACAIHDSTTHKAFYHHLGVSGRDAFGEINCLLRYVFKVLGDESLHLRKFPKAPITSSLSVFAGAHGVDQVIESLQAGVSYVSVPGTKGVVDVAVAFGSKACGNDPVALGDLLEQLFVQILKGSAGIDGSHEKALSKRYSSS
ncbi:Unknown protein sequence [Pseudomonas amygdali pv. lachrymans]|uniref:Uncharacterized protein n=1 Tax=Pseudomonas amygdali pv. lachrymans TaxID=53707 RepID=A0ABR5KRL9_PSEAV|nr:Unknown protein sequence [Pseudomonas amygdali pv. lachrymans]